MAKNKVYDDGANLSYKVGVGTKSGDPVRIGSINGVAITDSSTNSQWGFPTSDNEESNGNLVDYASVDSTGVWRVPVTITTTDKTEGTLIYAIANGTASIKKVTLTDVASGNKVWGVLVKDAKVGAPTQCFVKVRPSSD